MTDKQLDLQKYKDINEQLLERLDSIIMELQINNALLKRLSNKEEVIMPEIRKDMILSELLKGRMLRTRDVMNILKVTKPTAIDYMTNIANDKKFILKNYKGSRGLMLVKKVDPNIYR